VVHSLGSASCSNTIDTSAMPVENSDGMLIFVQFIKLANAYLRTYVFLTTESELLCD
jgi:hypothetical protein